MPFIDCQWRQEDLGGNIRWTTGRLWILSSCLIEHLRTPAWGNNQPLPPLWPWPGLIHCKLGERLAVWLEVTKWQVEQPPQQQEARIGYKAEAANSTIHVHREFTLFQMTPDQTNQINLRDLSYIADDWTGNVSFKNGILSKDKHWQSSGSKAVKKSNNFKRFYCFS